MSIHEYSGMTRAEMLLKVVMSSLEPASAFVEQYVRFVQGETLCFVCMVYNRLPFTESDSTELSKLLDMKGVKKSDQGTFIELYREQVKTMEVSDSNNMGSDSVASPLHSSPAYSGADGSRIAKLEKMIKNRL